MIGPMDVSVVNPFLNSTIRLFKEMFHINPTYGKPFIVAPNGNHRWEISGIIGIVGEHEGVIVFRITSLLAQKLLQLSGVSTKDPEETDQVLREMIGEFANIISGNAIAEIQHRKIEITPPVVIQGKNHNISWQFEAPIIGVPFVTSYGPFEVQICIPYQK